jgi:hypothetical protein
MTLGPLRKRLIGASPVSEFNLPVVLVLHPSERRLVEPGQAQVGYMLKHGHQPAFDGGPEDLDLGVGLGRIGQGHLLQHAEPGEAFNNLRGVAILYSRPLIHSHCPEPG